MEWINVKDGLPEAVSIVECAVIVDGNKTIAKHEWRRKVWTLVTYDSDNGKKVQPTHWMPFPDNISGMVSFIQALQKSPKKETPDKYSELPINYENIEREMREAGLDWDVCKAKVKAGTATALEGFWYRIHFYTTTSDEFRVFIKNAVLAMKKDFDTVDAEIKRLNVATKDQGVKKSRDFKRAEMHTRSYDNCHYIQYGKARYVKITEDRGDDNEIKLLVAQLNAACDMNAEIQKLKSELKSHEENVILKCLNERIESLLSVIVDKDAEMIKAMCEMGARIERMRREKDNLSGSIKRHVEKEAKLLNENIGLKNTISEMELELTNVFNGSGVSKEHCESFEGLKAIAIKNCTAQQLIDELATRGIKDTPPLVHLYNETHQSRQITELEALVQKQRKMLIKEFGETYLEIKLAEMK